MNAMSTEDRDDAAARREAIRAFTRTVLPLVTIFAVAGFGVFLQNANETAARDLSAIQRPFAPGCGVFSLATTKNDELLFAGGFYSFAAVSELLFVTQLGVMIFALVVFVKLLKGKALLTALVVAGAASSLAATIPSKDVAPTTVRLLERIEERCANIDEQLITQERLGAFAATLLACTLGSVLFRRRPPTNNAEMTGLARRMRILAAILYAGTILLVISLLRLGVLYDWIATTWPAADEKAVGALSAGLLRVWGFYYTTILAAIYLPGFALLRGEARSTVEHQQLPDVEAQDSWMKTHGLTTEMADALPRILAILAPVLVGELHKLTDVL
jgi:hypothetical protein